MALKQNLQPETDPFARAIPGQSLTDYPGMRPYETPPTISSPEEYLEVMESSLKTEDTSTQIADLLEVGISCETICEGITMKSFTEGMISPDVAELAKPGIFFMVAQIGDDHDIDEMVLFNETKDDSNRMNDTQKLALMQNIAPQKFRSLEENARQEQIELEELQNQSDMGQMETEEEIPSFMDMETPMEEPNQNVEEYTEETEEV